jgi:hypothetical protein
MLLDMSLEGMLDRIGKNEVIPIRMMVWACAQTEWKVIRARVQSRNASVYKLHGHARDFDRQELFVTKDEALNEIIRRIQSLKDNEHDIVDTTLPKRGRPKKKINEDNPFRELILDQRDAKQNVPTMSDKLEAACIEPLRKASQILDKITYGAIHEHSKNIH